MPCSRKLQKLVAPVLACVLLGSSVGAPMALASTSTPPVVSLDSTQKIHPLLQYAAKADPNRVLRVIIQKTSFGDLGGGGLLGGLLGPGVPGMQVSEDFKTIPASVATLPASSLPALAALSNVRYVSPDGALVFNPGLLPLVSSLLSPVLNLLGGLLGSASSSLAYPAPRPIAPTSSQVSARNLLTTYPIDTGASSAWSGAGGHVETGTGVGVAVIDSGLDVTHPDLAGRSIAVNLNANAQSAADGYGHGTHVAGIINGLNRAQQYVGVAPDATLIGVKVADDAGAAYESDLLRGLDWVDLNRTTYHIRVVNMSVSTSVPSSYATSPIDAAVEHLWHDGVTVVASAGNFGTAQDAVWYAPGNDPLAITVGCLDENQTMSPSDDSLCPISSRGITEDGFAKPDLVAPGRKIVSVLSSGVNGKASVLAGEFPDRITADGQHIRLSGTSMSAPIVSGALALVLQRHSQLTPSQLKQILVGSTVAYPGQADRAGTLNITAALAASDHPPANSTLMPVPVGGSPAPAGAVTLLWDGSRWGNSYWDGARWTTAYWDGARWTGSMEWDGARWTTAYWDGARWTGTYWDGARWTGAAWQSGGNFD